jgi:hypothetical protein
MDVIQQYQQIAPIAAAVMTYAGYYYYMQQMSPSNDEFDQMSGAKIAAVVAIAVFIIQQNTGTSIDTNDVLTEPFHDHKA